MVILQAHPDGFAVQRFAARRVGYLLILVAALVGLVSLDGRRRLSHQRVVVGTMGEREAQQRLEIFRNERLHAHSRHELHAKLVKMLALIQAHAAQQQRMGGYVRVASRQLERAVRAHKHLVGEVLSSAVATHHRETLRGAGDDGATASISGLDERLALSASFEQEARQVVSDLEDAVDSFGHKAQAVLLEAGDAMARTRAGDPGKSGAAGLKALAEVLLAELKDDVRSEREEERVGRWLLTHMRGYQQWLQAEAARDEARFETRAEADVGAILHRFHARVRLQLRARQREEEAAAGERVFVRLTDEEYQRARALLRVARRADGGGGGGSGARVFDKAAAQMDVMLSQHQFPPATRIKLRAASTYERFEAMLREAEMGRAAVALGGELDRWERGELSDAAMLLLVEQRVAAGALGAEALLGDADEVRRADEAWEREERHVDAVVFKDGGGAGTGPRVAERRHYGQQHNMARLDTPDLAHKVEAEDALYGADAGLDQALADLGDKDEHGLDEWPGGGITGYDENGVPIQADEGAPVID
eukprot:g2523.t1